jgi:limonene-1,2-epoxide hydrolase
MEDLMNAEQAVRAFCKAVSRCKSAELVDYFTPDAVYHNIPVEPVQGHDAIRATLEQFLDISSVAEFDILALAVAGNTVLTERIDRFTINDKRVELSVMGAFEVATSGKISAWRDYFDMQQFIKQLG